MAAAKRKTPDRAKIPNHFYEGLGRIRQWIDGFEAAGKHGPFDKDVLRQIQVWIKDQEQKS